VGANVPGGGAYPIGSEPGPNSTPSTTLLPAYTGEPLSPESPNEALGFTVIDGYAVLTGIVTGPADAGSKLLSPG
jgi:hypothetical protein